MTRNKAELFYNLADALEGKTKKRVKVAVTVIGSEHPSSILAEASNNAANILDNVDVVLIGPKEVIEKYDMETYVVENLEDAHKVMDDLLDEGKVDAGVTMHYNFPLGLSTVGRVITPGLGKPMFIATSTGTSATDRVKAMVKNAIYGIITAKASGIEDPSVGILNLDGARQAERILKKFSEEGYEINFAETKRADGGCIMRGNDLLTGSCDIMVCDTLTGNLLMKIFSAYTTGGSYESLGWGYGPCIGENIENIVMILSRTSGAPVVEGAIAYAAQMVRGNVKNIAKQEFEKLRSIGYIDIIEDFIKPKSKSRKEEDKPTPPPKKVVTEEISGIDVLQMDDAVYVLWENNVYAESGMGCTGPVILVNEDDLQDASTILEKSGLL